MNKRIQELAEQAFAPINDAASEGIADRSTFNTHWFRLYNQKFAELIVQECIQTIENRAPGQMDKEGEGWTNGYDDGLKTGAWLIRQHFGNKE